MKILLSSKEKYKELTGNSWNPNLLEALLLKKEEKPSEEMSTLSEAEKVLLEIKQTGDNVRTLKSQKADKVLKCIMYNVMGYGIF